MKIGDKVRINTRKKLLFTRCIKDSRATQHFFEFLQRYRPINVKETEYRQCYDLIGKAHLSPDTIWKVKFIGFEPFLVAGEKEYRIIVMNERREVALTWTDGVELINNEENENRR